MNIIETNPYEPEAVLLLKELSDCLNEITGSSGQASFHPEDVCNSKSLFVIVYDDKDIAIGCGGIRPLDSNIAEVKRMYANKKSSGVGTCILQYLENRAKDFGYSAIRIETRLINKKAVLFYEKRGYNRIQNYGIYEGRPEAVCFEKMIRG